jgi:hypothetical protein
LPRVKLERLEGSILARNRRPATAGRINGRSATQAEIDAANAKIDEAIRAEMGAKPPPPPPEIRLPPGYRWTSDGNMWRIPTTEDLKEDARRRRPMRQGPTDPWSGKPS